MATYYFEGNPILAPLSIESRKIVLSSETGSQKIFRREIEGQRWDLSFRVSTNSATDLFISMLDNTTTTNQMIMPQLKEVDDLVNEITETPTLVSNAVAGATTVIISCNQMGNYGEFNNKVAPKGSFIQFNNHDKIYVLKQELIEGSSRLVSIFPALQSDVPSGTLIFMACTPVKPQFTYKRSINTISGITYTDGILVDTGNITLEEMV